MTSKEERKLTLDSSKVMAAQQDQNRDRKIAI
jgi:hypothetical protein